MAAFGSDSYGREELIAGMDAAFLAGDAGIVDRMVEASAAYIDAWLKKICKDAKIVVTAAAQAQKAADLILAHQHEGGDT